VGCLALAAGAILYCVGELFAAGRRMAWNIVVWGLMGGFLVAFGTDLVLKAAGPNGPRTQLTIRAPARAGLPTSPGRAEPWT